MKDGWARIAIPLGLLVLALIAAPFLVQGDDQTEQQLDQNRQTIGGMTEAERERLDYNFEDFQEMSPEQQQVIRDLHQTIETDARIGKGELARVLDTYARWLQTVEPPQRDELLRETNPDRRITLIRDILRKQREQVAERATHWEGRNDNRRRDHEGMEMFRHPIAGDDLKRVMTGVEEHASDRLSDQQRKDLEGRTGLNRYVELLSILRESEINRSPLKDAPPEEFRQIVQGFDNYVEDSWLRDFLSSESDEEARLKRFTWQLHYSLNFELAMQVHKAKRPVSQMQLEEFFKESLSTQEQNELLSLEAQDFVADLRNQYLNQQLSDLPDMKRINEIFTGEELPFRNWRGGGDRRRNWDDKDHDDRDDHERDGHDEDRRRDGPNDDRQWNGRGGPGPQNRPGEEDRDGRGRGLPPFERGGPRPGPGPQGGNQFRPPPEMQNGPMPRGPMGRPPFGGPPSSNGERPPRPEENANGGRPPAPNAP